MEKLGSIDRSSASLKEWIPEESIDRANSSLDEKTQSLAINSLQGRLLPNSLININSLKATDLPFIEMWNQSGQSLEEWLNTYPYCQERKESFYILDKGVAIFNNETLCLELRENSLTWNVQTINSLLLTMPQLKNLCIQGYPTIPLTFLKSENLNYFNFKETQLDDLLLYLLNPLRIRHPKNFSQQDLIIDPRVIEASALLRAIPKGATESLIFQESVYTLLNQLNLHHCIWSTNDPVEFENHLNALDYLCFDKDTFVLDISSIGLVYLAIYQKCFHSNCLDVEEDSLRLDYTSLRDFQTIMDEIFSLWRIGNSFSSTYYNEIFRSQISNLEKQISNIIRSKIKENNIESFCVLLKQNKILLSKLILVDIDFQNLDLLLREQPSVKELILWNCVITPAIAALTKGINKIVLNNCFGINEIRKVHNLFLGPELGPNEEVTFEKPCQDEY